MNNRIVQSVWIGDRLSSMERLGISSFLAQGHEFHLFCYQPIDDVPVGTVLRDGNEILPRHEIFTYGEGFAQGSHAAFSNFFRYKLLLERGGWWVDTDVVCLRAFDFPDERVWGTERADPPRELFVSTSVIKTPPGDRVMEWAWRACQLKDTSNIRFGEIGPRLLQKGIDALSAHASMKPHTFFSPIPFYDWHQMLDPTCTFELGTEVYGVHLWNQMWRAAGVDKDASFPADCFYEHLKRRFLSGEAVESSGPVTPQITDVRETTSSPTRA
jgi:hypothetical protein